MTRAYLDSLSSDERAEYLTVLGTRIGMMHEDKPAADAPRADLERAHVEACEYVAEIRGQDANNS